MDKQWRDAPCCYSLDLGTLPPLPDVLPEDMPPQRIRRFRTLLRPQDKVRCWAGWLLMRDILGQDACTRLCYGRYGKPFLPGGPYFSLSHSGRYTVLAVAPMPVGVDVEEHTNENCTALAAQALHTAEQAYYASCPDVQTFFDVWTLKESYLKLRGRGLTEDPASFALSLDDQGVRLAERPTIHFHLYHQFPGYSMAICLYCGTPPATVIPVRL